MTIELKDLVEKQGQAVAELRKSLDNNEKISQEKLAAIKADFIAGEEANKKILAKIDEQEKKAQEQTEIIKNIEKKFYRFPDGTKDVEKAAEIKSFENYILNYPKQEKTFRFDEMDVKYLRTDLASDGGVLVPETLFNELVKQEIEISPILANSRVINSQVKSLTVAVRTTIPTVNKPGEGGTSTASNSKYKSVRLEAYRNDVVIPISREELNFAAFNMREQMSADAALALTQQTNIDFLTGDGVSKSEGILSDTAVKTVNSGIANDITLDNFYQIQKKDNIKTMYRRNGKFYLNSNTLFDLLQRKGGDGQYLWSQNVAAGLPNTLAGAPYIETPDMPDIGTNNTPVLFGDLRQAYYILRAVGIELVIDPYSSKKDGLIEYMWIEFLGGKVVLAEAIAKLKCAV